MLDKKDDTFFDEKTSDDEASEHLRSMIEIGQDTQGVEVASGVQVTGKITKIGAEYAFVDIHGKNEAIIALGEFGRSELDKPPVVGDSVTAYVVSNKSGETILSRRLSSKGGAAAVQELMDAMNNRVPVQGKVTGINKGGLNVKVLGTRAFCPSSQIDYKFTEDINSYLGKTLDFVITRITEGGRNVVLSRVPLLERGLEKKIDVLVKVAEAKLVLKGTVTRVAEFGLFVDLGECEGLVHISEVSWDRAERLAESYTPGQQVEVVVLGVERKSPLRNSKISLSIKQTLDNPWLSVADNFSVGQSLSGRVTRFMPFGAFVELTPGVEGLVHVSQMSWTKRVQHPSDVVAEGQQVQVVILAIDIAKHTISLSLKDSADDPWRDVDYRFPVGSYVTGTVVRKAKFGYFIDLAEGVTGLLPHANIAPDKKTSIGVGSQVTVNIHALDTANRRISLSLGMRQAEQESAIASEYLKKQSTQAPVAASGSTEFGAALLAALKKKS